VVSRWRWRQLCTARPQSLSPISRPYHPPPYVQCRPSEILCGVQGQALQVSRAPITTWRCVYANVVVCAVVAVVTSTQIAGIVSACYISFLGRVAARKLRKSRASR
jgi:hypothetical protein